MDSTGKILERIGAKSKVEILTGKFVGLDGLRVRVDFGAGPVPMETLTAYRPQVNELVQVLRVDGSTFMVGTSIPQPGQGVVASIVDDDYVTVTTDIGEIQMTHPDGLALLAGDQVKLYWSDGPYILSVMATTPPRQEPDGGTDENPTSGQVITPDPFTATWSGQWSHTYNKWQSNYPRASDTVSGAWGYGTKVNATIPDDSTIISIEIYLPLISELGEAYVGVHDYADQPPGWTGIAAQVPMPGRSGWVRLPNAFGDWLRVHNAGIAVTSGNGDTRWVGFPDDGLSGALRISYQLA
jgi:hypothetical protein